MYRNMRNTSTMARTNSYRLLMTVHAHADACACSSVLPGPIAVPRMKTRIAQ